MNKAKKFIWIPIVLIVAIVAVIIVLCLVRVNPVLDNFGGYNSVALYVSSDANEAPDIILEDGKNATRDMIESGLDASGFSYMHAILEGKFSYGLELKYDPDESEKKETVLNAKEIATYGAFENEYVIKLGYNSVRTLKVGNKEIKYDAVLIRLFESSGEVADVECVPYLSANVNNEIADDTVNDNGVIGSEYYETNVLLVKMNTSKLMSNIREFKQLYEV